MRYSVPEKYEIIRLVEESSLPIRKTLRQLDIHKSTFYNWLNRYQEHGVDGLWDRKPAPTLAWHRSMKNQILLNHYYLPSELQDQLQHFVSYYNHERYHESLDNPTPADVFYGRGQTILDQREGIKVNTLAMRRKMHYDSQTIYTTR